MVEFVENDHFVMVGGDDSYHCRYTFRDFGEDKMELEYYEWMDSGELEEPFTQAILEKLKSVLEK